jgi:hypothetical protein
VADALAAATILVLWPSGSIEGGFSAAGVTRAVDGWMSKGAKRLGRAQAATSNIVATSREIIFAIIAFILIPSGYQYKGEPPDGQG